MKELRLILTRGAGERVIPVRFQELIEATNYYEGEALTAAAFSSSQEEFPQSSLPHIWKSVRSIYTDARDCSEARKDEAAWCKVVRNILKLAMLLYYDDTGGRGHDNHDGAPKDDYRDSPPHVFQLNNM